MVSEPSLNMKHLLTNILTLFYKLSQAKIFPREASHNTPAPPPKKKDTLNRGRDFQMILQGKPETENEET